jgi:Predicted hydrolases of the HAD superfamily
MRYLALAADYDGTLAMSGSLSAEVEGALEQLRSSGTSGGAGHRQDVRGIRSGLLHMALFDCVVLENGAVLYSPSTRQLTALCPPASPQLARELTRRGVEPVIRGQAIVATRRPNEIAVLETIRDLGLELQIIFNGARSWCCPPA